MCEWLLSSEWSDVRLQCGGRSFAAHRAVLASVSTFLHRILLSCPTEDLPTFIVLPDFDLDAMSSVLYYIYNGEVVIQKHKLEMFMEIVRAMQIFIDEQYLPSGRDVKKLPIHKPLEKKKVYCLGENTVGNFINLKKASSDCFLLKKSSEDISGDKKICTDLGNMESSCEDRQRTFLRDLFIETYPQNGNANGRAAGVLAIQSARYRAPASQLLMNANGKHLRVEDTREMHTKSTLPQYFTNYVPSREISNINDRPDLIYSAELNQLGQFNSAFSLFKPSPLLATSKNESKNHLKNQSTMYQPQIGMHETTTRNSSINIKNVNSNPNNNLLSTRLLIDDKLENKLNVDHWQSNLITRKRRSTPHNTHSPVSKLAVLNEVLDSPWRPRQPTNYRPFRRKTQDSPKTSENNLKKCTVNDSNNNIQASPSPSPGVLDRLSGDMSMMKQPFPVVRVAVAVSDFKCVVCDQVFINEEALSVHTRRHSIPARYSCTECSKSFSQLRNFKYHMSVHRGTREFAATCSVCGKYFNDRGYLSSHMKIHRNRKEYKCSQCPKSFNQRVAYNMHVRIHTGVKPHICSECGKAFSRKMLLKQHQRTHSGERPYACTHCDKRFADRSNMTLHLRLHTGVKPFSCTLCSKSFTKKHHLKSHLNFHTGAKPYSCPKCKLAFTQSSNMRTHLKKCTAPEPTENADTQNSH